MKYFLHYVGGKLYPKEVFIKEAQTIGVNRCLPLRIVKHLKFGDKILLATFVPAERQEKELCPTCKTELEHININNENVFGCPKCNKEVKRINAIKDIIDGRKNKKDGTAEIFGYFTISGLNIKASDLFKQVLISKLDIVAINEVNQVVQRQCGNYKIGNSYTIKNSLEDISTKIETLIKETKEEVKVFISGTFKPLTVTLTPVNFSRTVVTVTIDTALKLDIVNNQTVNMILDYNKRAYIKKYEKRGRPRKVK